MPDASKGQVEASSEELPTSPAGLVQLEQRVRWEAHDGQVNVAILEEHGEARRAYTGCWDSASLRCWDLPEVGPPHSTGELRVGGFLNAVAKLREDVALVAVSAGLIPTPGESLKVYDLSPPLPSPKKAKSCFLHTRGCRALALWPRPGDAELAASISKDTLAVSRVRPDGGLQEGPPAFSASNPHNMQEVMALSWQEEGCLCSGGTAGTVKAWDLNSTAGALWTCCVCPGTWIRHLTRCSSSGCLVVGHSEGLCWVDGRTGQPVGHIEGLGQAYASASITEDLRIVAFGRQLMALDRRAAAPAPESAATLDAAALSLSLQSCGESMQSMLVGSKDGAARLYAVHA